MIWGVRYLQEAHGLDYASAVMRSAMVPLGWIIGCPLLGFHFRSDWTSKAGHRRLARHAAACLAWILFGPTGVFPPYASALVAGMASGAAMLPYTVIKEANPPQFGGIATGVVNFLNFTFSALLGPVFGWVLHARVGRSWSDGISTLPDGVRTPSVGRRNARSSSPLTEGDGLCRLESSSEA